MSCVAELTLPISSRGTRGSVLQCVPNGKTGREHIAAWGGKQEDFEHAFGRNPNIHPLYRLPCFSSTAGYAISLTTIVLYVFKVFFKKNSEQHLDLYDY